MTEWITKFFETHPEIDPDYMIAGKTLFEIALMPSSTRSRWYKTISPEEREEAMKMMENIRQFGISENNSMKQPDVIAKHKAIMKQPDVIAKHKEAVNRPEYEDKKRAWWTPERRDEQSARMTVPNNPLKRPDVIAKHKEAVNRPEYKANARANQMGESNSMYGKTYTKTEEAIAKTSGENHWMWKGGIRSDPQYYQRRRLRKLDLPEDFIEASFHQKKHRTDIESKIEHFFIANGIFDYEFQKRIELDGDITHTEPDFFRKPFCVYVDGYTHVNNNCYGVNQQDNDIAIDKELMVMGFVPIRLWYRDILDGDRPWLILSVSQPKYEQQSLASTKP